MAGGEARGSLIALLKALEDGDKLDACNRGVYDTVRRSFSITPDDIRNSPSIKYVYDKTYRTQATLCLYYEFFKCSKTAIDTALHANGYDYLRARVYLLEHPELHSMRKPRPKEPLTVTHLMLKEQLRNVNLPKPDPPKPPRPAPKFTDPAFNARQVLGLSVDDASNADTIQARFRVLARQYHTDKGRDPETGGVSETASNALFQAAKEARDLLLARI